ncbi:unnamed protein product, partial [Allacma fusca]
MADFLSK